MRMQIKASHYCLLFTFISTLIMYLLFGFSTITVACLFSGVILSVINLVEDEMKRYSRNS
ncbi:hypothetical protein [Bacillus sp. J33]|uniref:hypothetical protein n=1 Tax=Bacillus sp. J33 TaxID=935836 RepID=UPI0005598E42|nr:hypothetical protein [Bacillus sp. J33]